jgi:hypothetical protein
VSVLPGPAIALTTGRGSLWAIVLGQQDTDIWRFTPATGEHEETVASGDDFVALSLSSNAVWVASLGPRTLSRIELDTNQTSATIEIARPPIAIAEANELVWVCVTTPL